MAYREGKSNLKRGSTSRAHISKALDHFLGTNEGSTYRKAELKTFVTLGVADKLEEEEISLLGSMLEFSEKTVESVMVRFLFWSARETAHLAPDI